MKKDKERLTKQLDKALKKINDKYKEMLRKLQQRDK